MTAPTLPPRTDATGPGPSGAGSTPSRRRGIGGWAVRSWTSARARVRGWGSRLRSPWLRSPWILGALAAAWAVAIGLVLAVLPMLVVWMATPQSGLTASESVHVAGLLWVVAHGTPIAIAGVTYSLLPWGLAIIPLLLTGYAGAWAARSCRPSAWREVVVLAGSATVLYSLAVAVASQGTARPGTGTGVLPAGLHALVLAGVGFGFGAVRGSGLDARALVPTWVETTLRAGVVAAASLLGLGALAASAALIVRVDDAVTMAESLHAGFWGGLALLALAVAYVPVLVVWSAAYLVGAGVVIGPAVMVSPFIPVTAPTQLPPFPLLAALPQSASPLAWALPVTGIVAGVVAGLLIARRARAEARLMRLGMALGAAVLAGMALALLSALASGSLGDLRLASLGPAPLTVGVLVTVLTALGALPSAVVTSPPRKPRLTVADPAEAVDASVPADLTENADEPPHAGTEGD